MITVDIYKDSKGRIVRYKSLGHAMSQRERDKVAYDQVCAAISVTVQLPILGLEEHLKLKPVYSYNMETGFFELKLAEEANELTEAILETMYYGLLSYVQAFPKYVEVKEHLEERWR